MTGWDREVALPVAQTLHLQCVSAGSTSARSVASVGPLTADVGMILTAVAPVCSLLRSWSGWIPTEALSPASVLNPRAAVPRFCPGEKSVSVADHCLTPKPVMAVSAVAGSIWRLDCVDSDKQFLSRQDRSSGKPAAFRATLAT